MGWMARGLAIGLLALATTLAAQNFSDGYSFLKAVVRAAVVCAVQRVGFGGIGRFHDLVDALVIIRVAIVTDVINYAVDLAIAHKAALHA